LKIQDSLPGVFPTSTYEVITEILAVPASAFNPKRSQYHSEMLLRLVQNYAFRHRSFNVVLRLVNADIFVSGLNFVFGEAVLSGEAALISLWRLKPEFYDENLNGSVFLNGH
jgi:archaemetzincin